MKTGHNPSYLLFILLFSILALVMLALDTIFALDPNTRVILNYVDSIVCVVFFADFLLVLLSSEKKLKYFITWGWLDLATCVPGINIFRWGRIARILRVFRVLRGLRIARIATPLLLEKRGQSAAMCIGLLFMIVITLSSISVLHFEKQTKSSIKTPADAIWWSFVTATTVGYGDLYPVTPEGKVVAVILMISGFALFGVFSGLAAAWFLGASETKHEQESLAMRAELGEIRSLLDDLRNNTRNQLRQAETETTTELH